jgi:hypothetical protein
MRKIFLRSFAIAFIALALLFELEFFAEWRRAGALGAGGDRHPDAPRAIRKSRGNTR